MKARRYAKSGVALYWIVDPFRQAIEVYRLEGDTYRQVSVTRSPETYESPEWSGVRIDLAELFE